MARISYAACPYKVAPLAQHVLLATPTYTGAVNAAYLHSFGPSLHALRDAGIGVDHMTESYNCHVDDARNSIVREFLAKDHLTDLVFLDADVGWMPDELVQLCEYDADLVAGVYPKRGDETTWPVYEVPGGKLRARADGLVEVGGAPTGFMRIRKHVLVALETKNAHRQFTQQNHPPGAKTFTVIFERTFADGHRWSGDYAFCRQWRAMGGKIFVAPEMSFSHVGEMEWTGTLGEFWRKRGGILHPRLIRGLGALFNGDPSPAAFADCFLGWDNPYAAQPALLCALHDLVAQATGPILETGSGLSTLVMAIAAERAGVQLHALEHDLDYLKVTQHAIMSLGLKNVTVHYAPLRPYKQGFIWYEVPDDLPDAFSVVLCDGPQQRFGRKGLFELLGDRLTNAVLVADDAHGDTLAPVEAWAGAHGRSLTICGGEGEYRKFAICPPRTRLAAE